eukprot:COSAG06_NODE_2169_length_7418_cov_25.032108_5_plen_150_part_00
MLQVDEEQSLHIKAAAGTGKTFVAMIFLQKTIDAILASKDAKRRVLIVAPNEPLVLMIVKWLTQRCKLNIQKNQLLKTVHVLHGSPTGSGEVPMGVRLKGNTIEMFPLSSSQQCALYDIRVVDEAHKIYGSVETGFGAVATSYKAKRLL